jgi:hypothetical protein
MSNTLFYSKSVLHYLLKFCRYDVQLSRLRTSPTNAALELPIPIIDVPLNRFSEPNLRYAAKCI